GDGELTGGRVDRLGQGEGDQINVITAAQAVGDVIVTGEGGGGAHHRQGEVVVAEVETPTAVRPLPLVCLEIDAAVERDVGGARGVDGGICGRDRESEFPFGVLRSVGAGQLGTGGRRSE